MSTLLTYALVAHVLSGVLAIGLVHLVFMHLLRKIPSFRYLRMLAGSSAVLFLISWISSGYYYLTYYGKAVKPKILEGAHPWAHQVAMESKEHVFLVLPFLAITLWLCIRFLELRQDEGVKKSLSALALVALIMGAFVAGAGILVSGAAR